MRAPRLERLAEIMYETATGKVMPRETVSKVTEKTKTKGTDTRSAAQCQIVA